MAREACHLEGSVAVSRSDQATGCCQDSLAIMAALSLRRITPNRLAFPSLNTKIDAMYTVSHRIQIHTAYGLTPILSHLLLKCE